MEKKKHRGRQIAVLILVCLLLAGMCAGGYYLYLRVSSGLFFADTIINGYDVSDMDCSQVLRLLSDEYAAPTLTIQEGGKETATFTLSDMGYTIDEDALLESVEECMREQNRNLLRSLFSGNAFDIKVLFDSDEEIFAETVTTKAFENGRTVSKDATLEYDEKEKEYYINPEVYGDEIDDADLQVMVRDYADKMTAAARPQEDGVLELPDTFYFLPSVTSDDEELNRLMNIYNAYCKARITLTFGEEEVVVDWDTVQDWLVIDDDEAYINDSQVESFVSDLANKYNTYHNPRTFKTSTGKTISYDGSDYGYWIDQKAEAQQLFEEINANETVTREPVYSEKGLRRSGVDDICGTYVEVNLTTQHLWYYKNGELVIETDVVTGMPKDDRETMTGVFTIPYKQTDITLSGGTGADAWSTEVTYWMPFYDGQGLHDASWRSSFGGNIYKSNGSHGCVNMPYDAAETVYNEMEERTPIFLYKEE